MRLTAGFIKVLLIALVIPAAGFAVGNAIIGDVNENLAASDVPPYGVVCSAPEYLANPKVVQFCDEFAPIAMLRPASVISALIGISIPLLYWFAARYAGTDRARIASVFPPLVRISLFILTGMVGLQGVILTYTTYIAEAYYLDTVHIWLVGLVGLGAAAATWKLFTASLSFSRRQTSQVIGTAVTREEEPGLYAFVDNLAQKLNAKAPDNIVVGLDPNFFVTSCDVELIGREHPITGETLYLSAPLCRLMTLSEVSAIVGHELGHFRGEDTAYSLRFAPVYSGLGTALGKIQSGHGGLMALARLPATSMLSFMLEMFHTNQAEISRTRELIADKAGISVSSPMDLATSLVKVTLYSGLWNAAREHNAHRLANGKITRNLSTMFQGLARYDVEHESLEGIIEPILDQEIAHPTDTHPTLGIRLRNATIHPDQINKESLLVPGDSAVNLIKGHVAIEEDLTALEHRFLVAIGLVSPPEDEAQEANYLLQATYHLAASMVAADGRIEPEEITVAEDIGGKMFEEFDRVEFRDCCNHSDELPNPVKVAEFLNETFSDDHKVTVMRYLNAIAAADGEVADSEFDLLCAVADALGVSRSRLTRDAQAAA